MNQEERLLKVILAPHVSEKSSVVYENNNTVVLKVAKDSNKAEITKAVEMLFDVKVASVRTLVCKGKTKRQGARTGRRSDWKKAYVTLAEGSNLELAGGAE